MSVQSILQKTRIKQLENLKGSKIYNVSATNITISTGANVPESFIQYKARKGLPKDPSEIRTAL